MRTLVCIAAGLVVIGMTSTALAQQGRLGERLRGLDRDGDRRLSRDEVRSVPAIDDATFARLDTDGDGHLDVTELRAAARARLGSPGSVDVDAEETFTLVRDVAYAEPVGPREGVDPTLLSLDIYTPRVDGGMGGDGDHPAGGRPVIVMIHGGGWQGGDKAHAPVGALKGAYFTGHGYVFVSINYRLSPAVRHPAHVQDVAAAIAWVHRNIDRYGGDASRLFVMGHSAGAHLAALVATDATRLEAEGLELSILSGVVLLDTGAYDVPAYRSLVGGRADALMRMYEQAFGDDEGQEDASPTLHVEAGRGIPPMLVMCSGGRAGAQRMAGEFAARLREAGTPAAVVVASDKDHAGINAAVGAEGEACTRAVMKFLADPVGVEGVSLE